MDASSEAPGSLPSPDSTTIDLKRCERIVKEIEVKAAKEQYRRMESEQYRKRRTNETPEATAHRRQREALFREKRRQREETSQSLMASYPDYVNYYIGTSLAWKPSVDEKVVRSVPIDKAAKNNSDQKTDIQSSSYSQNPDCPLTLKDEVPDSQRPVYNVPEDSSRQRTEPQIGHSPSPTFSVIPTGRQHTEIVFCTSCEIGPTPRPDYLLHLKQTMCGSVLKKTTDSQNSVDCSPTLKDETVYNVPQDSSGQMIQMTDTIDPDLMAIFPQNLNGYISLLTSPSFKLMNRAKCSSFWKTVEEREQIKDEEEQRSQKPHLKMTRERILEANRERSKRNYYKRLANETPEETAQRQADQRAKYYRKKKERQLKQMALDVNLDSGQDEDVIEID